MKYLIIGGTGTLGNQLTETILKNKTNHVFIYSRDENKQWSMKKKFQGENITFIIGDIRDKNSIEKCILNTKPNIVILAAALKHIDICEYNPTEAVATNIIGIQNCIEAAEKYGGDSLEKFLFISTDKACNPINVYGQCKSIAEKLIFHAAKTSKIKFLCVRYGNVFNSRGSLIDLLTNHRSSIKSISLTHPEMTRFFMLKTQAEELIFDCLEHGENGQLWVRKAPSFLIKNILQYYSSRYNLPIEETGIRPGEKIHEELYSKYESQHVLPFGEYFIIDKNYTNPITASYNSSTDNTSYQDTVSYIEKNANL